MEEIVNYLNDTILILIENAQEIDIDKDFDKGIRFGYYSSISLLLNQADAFMIRDKLKKEIQDFVPENLLQNN